MLNFNNVPFTLAAQQSLVQVCYHATASVIDKEYINALGKYWATLYNTYGGEGFWYTMRQLRESAMSSPQLLDFVESCFEETAKNL